MPPSSRSSIPTAFTAHAALRAALRAVGELLAADGHEVGIIVVGGASLNLLGLLERGTSDVDVLAVAQRDSTGATEMRDPAPLPAALARSIATVARDLRLPDDWMNTDVALQWKVGLPPTLPADLTWETFGGLTVGLAGRQTLIMLKLFAATDSGQSSVHMQDLIALRPTDAELAGAADWVKTQDASDAFPTLLAGAIEHVRRHA